MLDFSSFAKSFHGDIVTPSDPDYHAAIARLRVNAQRRAQIVAFVKTAEDVGLAIKYATDNNLPLAIKCGGHSPGGASSSEGLVIDLSRHMNQVRIDAQKKLAYVGGGALWEVVDKAAIEHELATVAGTVNHTGVGGLTLGGGFGWLSGTYGLAIDNLVQAIIVTANGSILTTSETENPDLFFGIRGGGSNFGVCTEFVFRLHHQNPRVFGGLVVYAPDAWDTGLAAVTEEWWARGPSEKESMIHIFTKGPGSKPIIGIFFFYNGTADEARARYKPFFDLQTLTDNTDDIPYEQLNAMINPFFGPGFCVYMKGIQHMGQIPNMSQAFKRAMELSINSFTISIIPEYFCLTAVNRVPNGKMAFFRRGSSNLAISASWIHDTPENTDYGRNCVHEIAKLLSDGQATTCNEQSGYGNWESDTDRDVVISEDRARSLFGENYPRLQEIKGKYDPNVVFSKWFVISPVPWEAALL